MTRRFRQLNEARKKRHRESRGIPRGLLTKGQRQQILASTGGRCHICGGIISLKWQADHVLAHSSGGRHSLENYLPAHSLCNNYRWDYSTEEFQWILKLGVWARTQIERETPLGLQIRDRFFNYERNRLKRRRPPAVEDSGPKTSDDCPDFTNVNVVSGLSRIGRSSNPRQFSPRSRSGADLTQWRSLATHLEIRAAIRADEFIRVG